MAEGDDTAGVRANSEEELHDDLDDSHHEPARKRQRVRLSCMECRRRKLSCSRELPCDRCLKSGTPERCSYEARPGSSSTSAVMMAEKAPSAGPIAPSMALGSELRGSNGYQPSVRREAESTLLKDAARDHERIRMLQVEIAQLKSTLSKQISDSSTIAATPSTTRESAKDIPPPPDSLEAGYFGGNNFRQRYFGPHNVWSSLLELTGISPFMKETAEAWLQPLNIQKKDRQKRRQEREQRFMEPDAFLESLLPSQDETNSLIAVYLDHFEQLYRIIHIPTFKKEYDSFWDPSCVRVASFTALILSMISVSCCLDMQTSRQFVGVKSSSFQRAERWIQACDEWFERQSQKHRKLVHYQIMCLLYLAKRVNLIKKKRSWLASGNILRQGVILGLHRDPDRIANKATPFNGEMRRRLWQTMVEFDLQASFDQGVPTLLTQLYNNTDAPRNIEDEGFDEDSAEIPDSKPGTEYTFSSYNHFSHQSLPLRLELTRLLTGPPLQLDWENVLQYTDLIMQEIDSLPAWDLEAQEEAGVSRKPILAHTLLHLQLRQYLIPLHQKFLKLRKHHSKYQVADFIYYNAARDVVMMHDRLFQRGIRTLYFLREDTMNAAINLCNVTLHQPRDSSGLIMSHAQETLKLIEKCIALKEDRVLRCGNNDPWGYSSMCAAYGLLETHLGMKTSDAAKASAAERFIGLHYKLLAFQVPAAPTTAAAAAATTQSSNHDASNGSNQSTSSPFAAAGGSGATTTAAQLGTTPLHRADGLPLSMPWLLPSADPSQLLVPHPDFNFDMLGSDLNELWGDWGGSGMV
ncbi:fungal-specific transcription factor domain-containing protein [Xylariaceae sp. FL0804]|nr:fungal-specific transcription factor domain-containing protein [Xylariaceae sp. FL0804]